VLDALQRAQGFLDENGTVLTGLDLTTARNRLDDVVASFTTHALNQDVGARGAKGETEKQRQLRITIRRDQMRPIAIIARQNLKSTGIQGASDSTSPGGARGAPVTARPQRDVTSADHERANWPRDMCQRLVVQASLTSAVGALRVAVSSHRAARISHRVQGITHRVEHLTREAPIIRRERSLVRAYSSRR
jgi:hypothetical protein